MTMLGIDVCSYQGNIDWNRVKKAGCRFAVLKCIMKGLNLDSAFLRNVKGCRSVGIPVGVYTYVYERDKVGAEKRARAAVDACRKANLKDCVIWWDVEDRNVFKTGTDARAKQTDSILAARAVITAAGYGFGVYCDKDFYTDCLNANRIGGKWWIASYGPNRVTAFGKKPERKPPVISGELCGWQYCSRGQVPGISGNVDLDIAYDDCFADSHIETLPYGAVTKVVTNKDGANLRRLPSGESEVMETVPQGTKLEVATHWTATNIDGSITVYVSVKYAGTWLWCAENLLV